MRASHMTNAPHKKLRKVAIMPTIQTKSKGQADFFRCPKLFCRLIGRTRCRKQLENLLPPEPGSHIRSLEQRVGHCFLACVQTQDLLLDRARGDEPDSEPHKQPRKKMGLQ